MTLETTTREEFDKRLDAANARRAEELQTLETKQGMMEQTLAHYERTLREIETALNSNAGGVVSAVRQRRKLGASRVPGVCVWAFVGAFVPANEFAH